MTRVKSLKVEQEYGHRTHRTHRRKGKTPIARERRYMLKEFLDKWLKRHPEHE